MNKLKFNVIVTVLLTTGILSHGQTETNEFKPSGKPYAKIFSNFHNSFKDGESAPAFEITRAYLGYGYSFSKNFSGKINIDVGSPDVSIGDSLEGETSLKMTAYLKVASLTYKKGNLSVDFGLIGNKQFKIQEKNWGHRYLFKSFQDAYKFGSSADLGISASYKIMDMISVDAIIMNGEGYKKIEADSIFRYGAGVTLKPIDGLTLRGYYDIMKDEEAQTTLATFIGYQTKELAVGAEYNIQSNNKMKEGRDFSGFSVYGSYQASKLVEGFLRYDKLSSVELDGAADPWNINKDGQLFIAGIELSPVKGLKITPNYQGWFPDKEDEASTSSFFINCELKF